MNKHLSHRRGGVVVVFCAAVVSLSAFGGWSEIVPIARCRLIPLGDLAGGVFTSAARAVTPDGRVAVGEGWSSVPRQPVRWCSEDGMINLGKDLGLADARALALSDDGSVIVGTATFSSLVHVNGVPEPREIRGAFRWTSKSGLIHLAVANTKSHGEPLESSAHAVSGDGRVVVGGFEPRGKGSTTAGMWTEAAGWVALSGPFPAQDTDRDAHTCAHGVSNDGSVIVGVWSDPDIADADGRPVSHAFRWTKADGLRLIDAMPGGRHPSDAFAISADGSTIVGTCSTAEGILDQAFKWTAKAGAIGLGDLPGGPVMSRAFGVSGDGSIVVGVSYAEGGSEAFIWDAQGGMRALRDIFTDEAAAEVKGWSIIAAYGISSNGRFVAGYGKNTDGHYEAFIVDRNHVITGQASDAAKAATRGD